MPKKQSLITADYLFLCDENFTLCRDAGLVFDEKIRAIGPEGELAKKYPQAQLITLPPPPPGKARLILPAFINAHTHLEFSANASSLKYGSFLPWLASVLAHREGLSAAAREGLILEKLRFMRTTGTGTVGEISSFGVDLAPCLRASREGMRVVFFNEILGTANLDARAGDFLRRFEEAVKFENDFFTPAISVHAAYSTHPVLAKLAIDLARGGGRLISTHFLESPAELAWLGSGQGGFKDFLARLAPNSAPEPVPFYESPEDFVRLFAGLKTLFTHCVHVKDFGIFDKDFHAITHCPVSNRLLSEGSLDLKKTAGLNTHLATDGLSSNISLSMLDELRAALLIHAGDPAALAPRLLKMATLHAGAALGLASGELGVGMNADFAAFIIDEGGDKDEGWGEAAQLALLFILHAKEAEAVFVGGKS